MIKTMLKDNKICAVGPIKHSEIPLESKGQCISEADIMHLFAALIALIKKQSLLMAERRYVNQINRIKSKLDVCMCELAKKNSEVDKLNKRLKTNAEGSVSGADKLLNKIKIH